MDKAKYAAYLQTPHWREVRDRALRYAEHRCQLCNSSEAVQVHHRTYERLGKERQADLTVLCKLCHEKHHDRHTRERIAVGPFGPVGEYQAPSSGVYACLGCDKEGLYRRAGALLACPDCEPVYRRLQTNAARARLGMAPLED